MTWSFMQQNTVKWLTVEQFFALTAKNWGKSHQNSSSCGTASVLQLQLELKKQR